MAWWRKKVVSPARRTWAAVSTRVRARNTDYRKYRGNRQSARIFTVLSATVSQISHFIPLHPKSEGQKAASILHLSSSTNKVDKEGSLSITVPFDPFPLVRFMTATKYLSLKLPSCRQRRQHTEASRGCADLWLQGRAGDVRDPDLGAGGGLARPQAPPQPQAAGVVRPPVVVHDRGRAIEAPRSRRRRGRRQDMESKAARHG